MKKNDRKVVGFEPLLSCQFRHLSRQKKRARLRRITPADSYVIQWSYRVRKRTDMRRISLYVRQTSHSLLPTSTSTKRRRQPIFAIGCRLFCNLSHLFRVGQVTAHTLRPMGERVKVNLHTRPGNTVGTFVPKFATTFLPHAHGLNLLR